MIPTNDSADMMKNAIGAIVATRSLKIRLAMGTWLPFHFTGTHFGQLKSNSNCDG